MKVKLLSALTAICLLLGCAVLGTSCVLADFSEVRSPSSTTASTTEALMISESGEDATLAPSVSEMQPSESGEPDPDCVHQAVEIPAVPSTCRLEGSENGTQCKLCGVVLSAPQVIPVSEHSFHESGICLFCGMPQGSVEGLDYLDLYNQTYGYEYLCM